MSYNGSGTFLINTAGQPVVSGTVISSTAFNALTADLATGLSTAITKDGQTTITANIPMANYKFTGLGVGSAAGDSANLSQVQSTAVKLLASVSGADTITAVGSPNVAAYVAGQMFYFVAAAANTGAVTINIDSLGAKSITRDGTTALAAGDIQSGEVCVIVYDGTQFQLVNGASQSAAIVTNSLTVNGTSSLDGAVTINDSGADVDFRIESDTNANAFFLDGANGNVGIGTSSPSRTFVVSGGSDPIAAIVSTTTTGTSQLVFGDSADDNVGRLFYDHTDNYLAFYTSADARMRLTSSGELLVGGTTALGNAAGNITLEAANNAAPAINLFRNDTTVTTGNTLGQIAFYGNDTTSNTPTALSSISAVSSASHAAGDNPTDVVFGTTPDGTDTIAEAGRITQAGSYVLKGGTTTAAAGVGIIFPATQVASANANSLDDYEEGTWTPTISGTTSDPTVVYATRLGYYTKVGRIVTISCAIQPNSTTASGSGNLRFTGLPFTSANLSDIVGTGVSSSNGTFNWGTNKTALVLNVPSNSSIINVSAMQNSTAEASIPVGNFDDSNKYLFFSLTYMAA